MASVKSVLTASLGLLTVVLTGCGPSHQSEVGRQTGASAPYIQTLPWPTAGPDVQQATQPDNALTGPDKRWPLTTQPDETLTATLTGISVGKGVNLPSGFRLTGTLVHFLASGQPKMIAHVDKQRRNVTSVSKPKYIVNVDEQTSKVISFADDLGMDLAKGVKFSWVHTWVIMWRNDHEHDMDFTVESSATPSPGAKSITLKANVVLRCGSDLTTVQQKNLKLAVGSKVTVGPVPMVVSFVKQSTDTGYPYTQIVLSGESKPDALYRIREITFSDAKGEPIRDVMGPVIDTCEVANSHFGLEYTLTGTYDAVQINITYYGMTERSVVPIALTTGVGF